MEDPKLPKLFPKAELRPKKNKWGKGKTRYTMEDSLMYFNSHYGTSICFDEETIDLTGVTKGIGFYLARDISRIKFPNCKKLLLTIPLVQVKELKPRMPNLTYFGLIGSGIGRFYLCYHFFKTLEELDLTGNEISKADSLISAKNLPNLKIIHLNGNPICFNTDEKKKLEESLNKINILYN